LLPKRLPVNGTENPPVVATEPKRLLPDDTGFDGGAGFPNNPPV
jgi:hypothetical protein